MSRKNRTNQFSWKKHFSKNKTPEQHIEESLIRLEKLDKNEFEFWRDYQKYLMEEREARIDDIASALNQASEGPYDDVLSRIVVSQYSNDPLSVYGSICEPGRFNFGALPSYYNNFGALYLANSPETAYLEKFHALETDTAGEGNLTPAELSLISTPSFLYVRADVKLDSYIDLRNDKAFELFINSIKNIKPSKDLKARWKSLQKKLNQKNSELRTVSTVQEMRNIVFDPGFKQWLSWLECPSPSQWLGHYARKAGVQGILYPSVRSQQGYNLAVFIDNFEQSDACIALTDKVAAVPKDRAKIDTHNFMWFSHSLENIQRSQSLRQ